MKRLFETPQAKVHGLLSKISSLEELWSISGDHLAVRSQNTLTYNVMNKEGPFGFAVDETAPFLLRYTFDATWQAEDTPTMPPLSDNIYKLALNEQESEDYLAAYLNVRKAYDAFIEHLQFFSSTVSQATTEEAITAFNKDLKIIEESYQKFQQSLQDLEGRDKNLRTKLDTAISGTEQIELKKAIELKLALKGITLEDVPLGIKSDRFDERLNYVKNSLFPLKDKLQQVFYEQRIKKNAQHIAEFLRQNPEINFMALQETDAQGCQIILAELAKLGWCMANTLHEGPSGHIATLYNSAHLTLQQGKSQAKFQDVGRERYGWSVDFFTSREGEEIAFGNMHVVFETNGGKTYINHALTEIRAAMGSTPGIIAGDPNTHLPEPNEGMPGQVGLSIIPAEFRDFGDGIADRFSDVILTHNNLGLSFPHQAALANSKNPGLSPICVQLSPRTEKENTIFPIHDFAEFHLTRNTKLFALLELPDNKRYVNEIKNTINENTTSSQAPAWNALIAFLELPKEVTPELSTTRQTAINSLAIGGITQYLSRNKSHLSWLHKIWGGERGVNRANAYLRELTSQDKCKTSLYKEIMTYCLLASKDGKTLQSDLIIGNTLLIELRDSLEARCLEAAGDDKNKAASYYTKLSKITDEIIQSVNGEGNISPVLASKVVNFERMLGKVDSKPLINNIINDLKSLNTKVGDHVHESLVEIKRIAEDQSSNNQWSRILKICKERTSPCRSALSHLSLFGLKNSRDPRADLLLRALAQFDKNRIFNPTIKNLEELLIAQQKREVIEQFENEIQRLTSDKRENLLLSPGLVRDFLGLIKSSSPKIDAYKELIKAIKASESNANVFDVLISKKSVSDQLDNKRGILESSSGVVLKSIMDRLRYESALKGLLLDPNKVEVSKVLN